MKKILKMMLLLTLAAALMMSTIACTGGSSSSGSANTNTTAGGDGAADAGVTENMQSIVRFGRDWPTYYDPAVGTSYTCSIAQTNIYDALVIPEGDQMIPHVATDWEISDDGLTYTFHLRDDVKFHSGNILKASDVVYSMKRLLTIGQGPAYLYTSFVSDFWADNDTTFVVKLSSPYGPFLNTLARFFIVEEAVVSQHYDMSKDTYGEFGDYGTNWMLINDAGSGPYKTYEFKLEEYLIGEKFDDYFLGWEEDAPQYFKISNMADAVAQKTAFANQELEITNETLPQETYAELEKMGAKIALKAGTGTWSMLINTKIAPTDDENFRKAMAYAFDYDTMCDVIFPSSTKVTGPVANGLFGKNTDLEGYSYNLDKAKEYLEKSKYAGDPASWVVTMSWCAEVPEQEKISLMYQASLAQLGIKLEITKKPFASMSADAQTIETTPNTSIVQWSPDYFEAGSVFKTRYHSDSTGTWEQMEWLLDSDLDAKIDDALGTSDRAEREAKYKEIEAYIYDLCPTIWMGSNSSLMAVQPYVEWDVLTASEEGKTLLQIPGYDMYFHDMKVHVDQRTK